MDNTEEIAMTDPIELIWSHQIVVNVSDFPQDTLYLRAICDHPGMGGLFYGIRVAFRMLHELSVRVTGSGFTFHDYIDEGIDLHSDMTMPAKITFHAED